MTKKHEYRVAYSSGTYSPYVAQFRKRSIFGSHWRNVGDWTETIEQAEEEANRHASHYSRNAVKYLGWLPKDDA